MNRTTACMTWSLFAALMRSAAPARAETFASAAATLASDPERLAVLASAAGPFGYGLAIVLGLVAVRIASLVIGART
jgi:hypothetical protein